MRPVLRFLAFLVGGAVLWPVPVRAHGFGQRYDLPVPLELWLAGAAAAVVLSFAVAAVFLGGARGLDYPRANLLNTPIGRLLARRAVTRAARIAGVGLLALITAAALLGTRNPARNLAPTAVWVVWWVGLAYVSALAGNLWALLNPWDTLFRAAERWAARRPARGPLSLGVPYPAWLGVWPAVVLFLAFAWAELVFGGRAVPAWLGLMIVVYSLLTWTGMWVFGRAVWVRHGDPFALFFGLFARFAPTEVRVTDPGVCRTCPLGCRGREGDCVDCYECFARAAPAARELNLRPFAAGLAREEAVSSSMAGFVLLVLATVTFDGFMATPVWADLETALYAALPALGGARLTIIGTLGLLGFAALLFAAYRTFAGWMAAAGGGRRTADAVAPAFVFSLVPIAIGYHLAHYFTYLLIQGQLVIPLASDPFGFGWNLLGTAGYVPDIGVVGARFAWHTAVIAIVAGHIVAVWVAHVVALREFGAPRWALRSQYPMLALMVGYTMLSLWIIAQPIVESGPRV